MSTTANMSRYATLFLVALIALTLEGQSPMAHAQGDCRTFSETGKRVCGVFLGYWTGHGGLAQQGLPMTGEFSELSATDGKNYVVQYFERAVFEKHPENKPPFEVLLSLLGSTFYKQKYGAGAPGQEANTSAGSVLFRETGKRLGGRFLEYWRANGGLAQQGYPISDEFTEKNELDGKVYRVQYFERAVFELHPENKLPFDVLLSQLGTFYVKSRYPNGEPDAWSTLRLRPLKLPTVAPGGDCPVSSNALIAPDFGAASGAGPVYAVLGAENDGTVRYDPSRQEGGFFYHKVLWFAQPDFSGAVLIRGHQIDGSGELRFGDGPNPALELTLTANRSTQGKWTDWPTETRLHDAGCYAFQVDTTATTEVIVYKAAPFPH